MLANTLLADTLAVLLGLGSFTFYMAAFFYPEVHRRSDFLWSGLGLFYAVVLWFCAGQMTGALLLGQMTAVVLLMGLGWETLRVRREKTPVYQQTPVVLTPEVVGDWAKNKVNQLRIAPAAPVPLRLEKRALGSQRVDPRRRPTYEYEFVEDGLLEIAAESDPLPDPLSLEALPVVTVEPPPSVEAEIISIESPEIEPALALNEGAVRAEEAIASEPEPQPSEPVVSAVAVNVSTKEDELDADWGDSFFGEDSFEEDSFGEDSSEEDGIEHDASTSTQAAAQAAPMAQPKPREKPTVLATPLIVAGWVKDVLVSLTKPKPSKPVIDIPRRESSRVESPRVGSPDVSSPSAEMAREQNDGEEIRADIADITAAPTPPDSNWDNSHEDSNWDD